MPSGKVTALGKPEEIVSINTFPASVQLTELIHERKHYVHLSKLRETLFGLLVSRLPIAHVR